MNKRLILTSFIAMGFAFSAMAETTYSGEFPEDELMQEDYTYTNAATLENMDGVFEGTVLAVPQYVSETYNVPAGYYLPAGKDKIVMCTAGNYCSGSLNQINYNENNNQILNSCSTATNGDYPQSVAGAGTITDCFRPCSPKDLDHATKVSGGVYYNVGNTCSATSCEKGYHTDTVYNTGMLWKTIGHTAAIYGGYRDSSGTYRGADFYSTYSGASSNNNFTASELGIESGSNKWALYYGDAGYLIGESICSTQGGIDADKASGLQDISTATSLTADGGTNCWCKVTGYKSGNLQAVSSDWVLLHATNDSCDTCSQKCANMLSLAQVNTSGEIYREALLQDLSYPLSRCVANTITIKWEGASQEDIAANEAGSCTYGGDVRTPKAAETIPGKIFTGWRFKAPEPEEE